jgi:hypothetical protein
MRETEELVHRTKACHLTISACDFSLWGVYWVHSHNHRSRQLHNRHSCQIGQELGAQEWLREMVSQYLAAPALIGNSAVHRV